MASGVVDRVQRVTALRASFAAPGTRDAALLRAGLRDVAAIRSWAAAMEAAVTSELASVESFPEEAIAAASRTSVSAASKTRERAATLVAAPSFAEALSEGAIAAGHVDELARAVGKLDYAGQRADLFERTEHLLGQAENSTIETFRRTLNREVNDIQRSDGMEKLQRQRRATSMSSWTDDDGMWNLRAKFDPLSALTLHRRIENMVDTLFSEQTPASCPQDPVEKQKHLKALALARLIADDTRPATDTERYASVNATPTDNATVEADTGPGRLSVADLAGIALAGVRASTRVGRPEILAVIDADQPNGSGGPEVDWGIPVEIPPRILSALVETGDVDIVGVVIRNGVVLHAPGELNMGRAARHANRAQRRALRAMYATCAVPGCATHFNRCKIHHIIWWSNGGRTDLDNLLPVCVHHHHKVHDHGWAVTLGANRQLTITLPDGNVVNTGPPNRRTG